jgi:hypothetical protein
VPTRKAEPSDSGLAEDRSGAVGLDADDLCPAGILMAPDTISTS